MCFFPLYYEFYELSLLLAFVILLHEWRHFLRMGVDHKHILLTGQFLVQKERNTSIAVFLRLKEGHVINFPDSFHFQLIFIFFSFDFRLGVLCGYIIIPKKKKEFLCDANKPQQSKEDNWYGNSWMCILCAFYCSGVQHDPIKLFSTQVCYACLRWRLFETADTCESHTNLPMRSRPTKRNKQSEFNGTIF